MEKQCIETGLGNKGAAYWMDLQHFDDGDPFFLAQVQKGIANFIKILTGTEIPVQYFASGDVLNDGKVVYISSKVNKNNIDSVVGLALHEASHILLTDFSFLRKENKKLLEYIYKIDKNDIDNIFDLINFIEDKRIDNFVYTSSPGYQYYYEQMYNKYFYSNIIDINLQKNVFNKPTWESYLFRIINIFNKNSNLEILPGLKEIYNIIDIKNINRLKTTKDSVEVAINIYYIIKPYIIEDIKSLSGEEKQIKSFLDKQKSFINSEHTKKRISKDTKKIVNQLSNSFTQLKYTNINKSVSFPLIITDDWDIYFSNPKINMENSVDKGFLMGKKLLKTLCIRNTITDGIYENQNKGKLHNKKLFQAPFNNTIFYKIQKEKYKKVFMHISLDLSSSMKGKKLENTIQTAVSIAYVACHLDNFDVEISFRGTSKLNLGNTTPILAYAFNSKKHKLHHLKKFKYLNPSGYTPEGICLNEIKNTLPQSSFYQDTYLINISDGLPNINSAAYNSYTAIEHTKNVISQLSKANIGVLSFYVKDTFTSDRVSEKNFKNMYGNSSQFIDMNNISSINNSINKLLTSSKISYF